MKKLFLLPLLALSLSGCQKTIEVSRWYELNSQQSLTVTYGVKDISFLSGEYSSIAYKWECESSIAQVEVRTKGLNNEKVVYTTFIGTNINIVVWGY